MPETISASAILLDMDGTLVDSTAVVERVWGSWAIDNALDPDEVIGVVHGRRSHDIITGLRPHHTAEENDEDNQRVLHHEATETEGIVEVRGAAVLLHALGGLPHALVTSAGRALADARMTAAGLVMPPIVITANDVAVGKPDPACFLAAASRLGVEAGGCIAFEDSAAGVQAARSAGMRVVGVGPTAATHAVNWSIPDLTSVIVVRSDEGLVVTL